MAESIVAGSLIIFSSFNHEFVVIYTNFHQVWQTGLPAGHPTYHVSVIKLKWEIIWTGGYPT